MNIKYIILIVLAIFLFSIASVSAGNTNETVIVNTDDSSVELSQNDQQIISQNDNNEIIGKSGSFKDLKSKIDGADEGSTIVLDKNYEYNYESYENGIEIRKSITIDGDGHTIAGKKDETARIFNVLVDNVILKNINFKNAEHWSDGGAVRFLYSGTVENCNFTDNNGELGGAICFQERGTVKNCNFINNYASYRCGAICFSSSGTVLNCNFTGNHADEEGGAVLFFSGGGIVTNCIFEGNSGKEGGALVCYGGGFVTADTCIFKTSSDTYSGAIIKSPILKVDNFTSFYGSGEKITFNLTTNTSSMSITNANISINVYFKNNGSSVGNYSCLSDEGWVPDLPIGSYYAVFNTAYAGFQPVNRTIKIIPNISYYVNVTSVTTTNKTVNITAKSNVPQDILEGKLLFILPNSTKITANYDGNGTWWTVHTFDKCMKYKVSAYYNGWDNVTVSNATITVNKLQTELSADAIITTYNIDKDLVITFKDSNGNPVTNATITVDLNGAKTYITDTNGQIKVSTAGLVPQIYTAKITFAENENYKGSSADVQITVNKANPILKAKNKAFKAKKKIKKFKIALKNNIAKPIVKTKVTLKIGKKAYNAKTNSKGKATFKIKKLTKKGRYKATVAYKGNNCYNKATKTVKILIK